MGEQVPARRLGFVPAPFAGESFVSWVDTRSVLAAVACGGVERPGAFGYREFSRHQFRLSDGELEGLHQRTGLRPAQVERMLLGFYAPTALRSLAGGTGRSWQRIDPWLRREHSAACPLCVQASGGRWLLSWRLKWTFLCADHLVYLVDRCPRCHIRLYWRLEATGTGQRTHCTRPSGRRDQGPRRLGAAVCGFPVAEIPMVPVEDEEAVYVQRRVSALLTPADAAHNEAARRALLDLAMIVHDAGRHGTAALLRGMEDAVVRAVHEAQGQPFHPLLSGTLERGAPIAVSALVRVAAKAVLSDYRICSTRTKLPRLRPARHRVHIWRVEE